MHDIHDDFAEIEQNEEVPESAPAVPEEERKNLKLTHTAEGLSKILHTVRRFFKKDSMPNLVLVMVLITSITAAGLGLVNAVTADAIEANEREAKNEALNTVFLGQKLDFEEIRPGVYQGRNSAGELVGFGVEVAPDGFAEKIEMVVGIDVMMRVTGIKVVKQRETTGFSNASVREAFLAQFNGQSGPFTLGDQVDAIAGATVSSQAVTKGVNEALNLPEQEGTE